MTDIADIRTARVVLDLLVPEATRAEEVLTKIATSIAKTDEALALAITAQARALKLAASEASKLITHLSERA